MTLLFLDMLHIDGFLIVGNKFYLCYHLEPLKLKISVEELICNCIYGLLLSSFNLIHENYNSRAKYMLCICNIYAIYIIYYN